MTPAGFSKSFFEAFKETTLSCIFDIGGIIAGFAIAVQLGLFELSPWAIALYPAVVSVKGVTTGLLTGRLSTALRIGTAYPKFFGNTKVFYKLVGAIVVLTLITSSSISGIAVLFGIMFWGTTAAVFPAILSVMVATLSLGLLTTLITIKVMFLSFKKSLDPELVVFPVISTLADIAVSLLYIGVLNIYFSGAYGQLATALIGLINVSLVFVVVPKFGRHKDFLKILKESLPALLLTALVVNITGTLLRGVNAIANSQKQIYIIYPAIIDMVGDVGLVVGSATMTRLALGELTPSFSSIIKNLKNIFSAWISSLVLFAVLGLIALPLSGVNSIAGLVNLLEILLVCNVIAFLSVITISYSISIVTFERGLESDNFVIPLISTLADFITTVALFVSILVII
jgi:cation transporter-like permease